MDWPLCPNMEQSEQNKKTNVDSGVEVGQWAINDRSVDKEAHRVDDGEDKDAHWADRMADRLCRMEETLKPDDVEEASDEEAPPVSQPTKLIRIASMTRAMLDEARQAPLDEGGRERMAEVHSKSVDELRGVLSPELQEEFNEIMIPLNTENASESELRVAQAQLIGWLEGLFHGIQASLWSQQMQAQGQLQEMQNRALGPPARSSGENDQTGLYL